MEHHDLSFKWNIDKALLFEGFKSLKVIAKSTETRTAEFTYDLPNTI